MAALRKMEVSKGQTVKSESLAVLQKKTAKKLKDLFNSIGQQIN